MNETINRPFPELLSEDEAAAIQAQAARLWADLQDNRLGGFSGFNRPFYIAFAMRKAIEEFGHRDTGLSWSKNEIDNWQRCYGDKV